MPSYVCLMSIVTRVVILEVCLGVSAEPIVLSGAMVPGLVGTPIAHLRIVNNQGVVLPFQVDEITAAGEYVCPEGESPNHGESDGKFDKQDEIVFLWEDADSADHAEGMARQCTDTNRCVAITISRGSAARLVRVVDDSTLPVSKVNYCVYDHQRQYLQTPYYYAQFAPDRFHFVRAGVMDFAGGNYVDLTKELRIAITLKMLWGLIPIRYTEESVICHVKRYKAGPVRLIRRGDFHLNLGLGLKGSRAAVYQMCYPQVVKVPVKLHLPVRFKSFFSDAFIEMTPVIAKGMAGKGYRFMVPGAGYSGDLCAGAATDTLIRTVPESGYMVDDGQKGYGWLMCAGVDPALLSGSGYIMRRPSKRNGLADCGLRLTVRDLPKGSYDIVNWVLFSRHSPGSAGREFDQILAPAAITSSSGTFQNLLVAR
jgi:hypothetical protein